MHPMQRIKHEARQNPLRIILPESTDARMLQAARHATDDKIAEVILVGDQNEIKSIAESELIDLDGILLIENTNHPKRADFEEAYYDLRKHKGVSLQQAKEIMSNPLFFAAMMVKQDEADGMVAGAVNTTGNVIRASLQIIGTAEGMSTVSSCFMMVIPDCPYGVDGTLMYGDCGVVPDPSAKQLADIAIATAGSMMALVGTEPVVAMLSFSTYGSAKHPLVDKVTEATQIAKERMPDLKIDGELQADAALIEAIGKKKAPESSVAGRANTLIFPDLNAGNIAYKLTERLANADAIGPLLQGLAQPVNDLSRGCNAEDIYNSIAITCVQAQTAKKMAV